jgi:hypothetical protein
MQGYNIIIQHEEDITDAIFDEFLEIVTHKNLSAKIFTVPNQGPMAGMELLLPTAAIILITKPFFDGFMNEMGKDAYSLTKKGLNKLWKYFFAKDVKKRILITSSNAPNKVKNKYSFDFSILFETNDGKKIKLLIPNGVNLEDYEKTINAFIDFIKIYENHKIDSQYIFSKTILVTYNKELDEMEFINPKKNKR